MINRDAMIRQLRLHEGERLKPYRCTAGKLTIGVGRNLEDRGITADESAMLLANDIAAVEQELQRALPWVAKLDEVRQRVLLDMAFNLGIVGLLNFKRTLAAVEAGQYQQAATMMLDSRWAGQVGQRAERLSRMMATGKDPRELWATGST
jgi:lysozyme